MNNQSKLLRVFLLFFLRTLLFPHFTDISFILDTGIVLFIFLSSVARIVLNHSNMTIL